MLSAIIMQDLRFSVVTEENHHLGHAPAVAWQICSEVSEELAVSITLMMEAAVPLHCWYMSNTLHRCLQFLKPCPCCLLEALVLSNSKIHTAL
jgi:hypothetical protein